MPCVYIRVVFVVDIACAVTVGRRVRINPEEVCDVNGVLENGTHVDDCHINVSVCAALKCVDGFVRQILSGVVYVRTMGGAHFFRNQSEGCCATPVASLHCPFESLSSMPSWNPPFVLVRLLHSVWCP